MGNCETQPQVAPDAVSSPLRHNPFFEPQAAEGDAAVLTNYTFISNYEDRFLGRASVVSNKDGNLFICKDIPFDNQQHRDSVYRTLLEKKDQQNRTEELLRIKQIFRKKVDGFLNDSQKLMLLIEYPLISLKKEFHNRMLNKLEFDCDEITRILYSAIRGYAAIQKSGALNSKVRMAHIFVGVQARESVIKVVDSSLLSSPTNLQSLILHGSSSNELHDIYLSPEQFKAYFTKNNLGYSPTSGVFSLGVTILDLCLMEPSRNVYHFHKKVLQESQVNNLIKIAGKRHGSNLQKFLFDMLQFDPLKRRTFAQLQASIPNVFRQSAVGSSSLRLSVVKKDDSKYIENDSKSLRNSRSRSRSGSVYSSRSSQSANRVFTSNIVIPKPQDQQYQNIHEEYTNGNQYIGQKKNGLKYGKGKYIFKDRSYYEGQWKNNMMHGKGVLYFPNGKVEYQGEWAEDEPNGWGLYYSYDTQQKPALWKKYEGQLSRGQMDGRGKLFFASGVVYQGDFKNGKIFGRGKRIDGGAVVEREWELQTLQEFIRNSASSAYKRES